MRIIAGSLGGRVILDPKNSRTHPMSEKMRGALFNSLGDLSGKTVLDAFAGSGALGFEALSRGAAHVLAIENDRSAQLAIKAAVTELGVSASYKLIAAAAGAWATTANDHFDVLLFDPPYDHPQLNLLEILTKFARPQTGVIVLSWPSRQPAPAFPGFSVTKQQLYGDGCLIFYALITKRSSEEDD